MKVQTFQSVATGIIPCSHHVTINRLASDSTQRSKHPHPVVPSPLGASLVVASRFVSLPSPNQRSHPNLPGASRLLNLTWPNPKRHRPAWPACDRSLEAPAGFGPRLTPPPLSQVHSKWMIRPRDHPSPRAHRARRGAHARHRRHRAQPARLALIRRNQACHQG